ncbi:hypothetical protein [Thiothrix lacustris]|jgi:hypothetical protein|uniref:Secreted protein n=1 Tax=Thiothrix lacustris TaxID=525917 RepID=A0ABY9MKM2_9GAMM|nr:hypothetical protein [Thiothrix lacustris]WML89156.1 hypothetical protein RCF98_09225 [Thiothrix lacustris]WMP15820.1 hypothetical protein RCS87_10470 [Thiothrix lacustris]
MRTITIALAALLLNTSISGAAFAQCGNGSDTLFHCTAQKSGKQIEVCDTDKTIDYSFGKPGKKPELALSVPRADVTTWQWNGIGRYMSYTVNIPNNDHVYRVFWGVDRLTDEHAIEAGVHVEKNGDVLATIYCKPDTVEQSLEGVDLKPEE